jgi:hypothetical protein
MSAVGDLIEEGYRSATAMHEDRLVSDLQDLLGQKLVAFAVGERHPSVIGQYARAERGPGPETLAQLVDLHTVVAVLRRGMRESSIKAWMMGGNTRLAGVAPIEAVHEGRADEVMGAAGAFVTGR